MKRLIIFTLCLIMIVGLIGSLTTEFVTKPSPVSAQTGPSCGPGSWDTSYYNDTNLTILVFPSCTPSSQLNQGLFWGLNSPIGGVNPNNYGVRFITNITFPVAGNYRFTANFQDGARLYINGQLTSINFWGVDIAAQQTSFADYNVAVANTTVSVTLEMQKFTGNGEIRLNWALGGSVGTPVPTGNPWTVEFFNNRTWTPPSIIGAALPAGPLSVDWQFSAPAGGVLADGFSSRFTRVVNFPTGGVVTFRAKADDTVVVRVDGQAVTASAPYFVDTEYSGSITLTPGNHTVVVEHTDIVAQAYVFVSWAGGGDTTSPNPVGTPGSSSTPVVVSPTGVTATVTASVGLNFRQGPTTTATKISNLPRGSTYAVLGRSPDSLWAYLEASGTRGWAYARWLSFSGDFNSVPVLDAAGNPIVIGPGTGIVMIARPVGNMRIRECPGFQCIRTGFIPWGSTVNVFGQSVDRRWIKLEFVDSLGNKVVGWSYKIWFRTADNLNQSLPRDLPFVQ